MTEVNQRNEWIFGSIRNALEDRDYLVKNAVLQMLNKTTRLFKYTNLPDTIKTKDLETLLQVGGFAILTVVDGKPYAFRGGLGGEPNPYYLPTIATVANPALRFDKNLKIGEDCVVMLNDNFYQGLMPLFSKYGNLISEAEISLRHALINSRIPALVQADNDNTYKSATEFFEKITKGESYGVISSKEFFDGIRSQEFYKHTHIKDIVESIQYLKGSWAIDIGINAPYNMKREAINEAEASLNDDFLYPTVDTMLQCRKDALKKFNERFGYDISVDFDGIWKQNRVNEELILETKEAELEQIEGEENEDNRNPDESTEN